MNKADQRIGENRGVVMFKPFGIQRGSLVISQIRPIRLMVEQQLFKAGAGNIDEAQLSIFICPVEKIDVE